MMTHVGRQPEKKCCPVCKAVNQGPFLEIQGVPLFCNVLYGRRQEALNASMGDIELIFCHQCGHVYNRSFDSSRMRYDATYDNSLHYSTRFQNYANKLARRLAKTYHLENKRIVEIGCGKGEFLHLLAKNGGNHCIGFDPSYESCRSDINDEYPRVKIIAEPFSEKYAYLETDMVVCRHVLEHIDDPVDFLKMIRRSILNNENAIVFIEVPNALFTLKQLGIWDLIYEHKSYFTAHSLYAGIMRAGFHPLSLMTSFGGQYLCIECRLLPGAETRDILKPHTPMKEIEGVVASFADHYARKTAVWKNYLAEQRACGKKVVVWGAGSKGVTFMNVVKHADVIRYAVDVSPHKQGKFCPGTAQRILSPDALNEFSPDVVIVMNPLYIEEITASLCANHIRAEIVSIMDEEP